MNRDFWQSAIEWMNLTGRQHVKFASTMFWQFAVLIGVLIVADLFLRQRARPVVRYWLWALVLLKLMLPVDLSTPFSIAYWTLDDQKATATVAPQEHAIQMSVPSTTQSAPAMSKPAVVPPAVPHAAKIAVAENSRQPDERHPLSDHAAGSVHPQNGTDLAPESKPSVSPAARTSVLVPRNDPRPQELRFPALCWPGALQLTWLTGVLVLYAMVVKRTWKVWQLTLSSIDVTDMLRTKLDAACALLRLSSRGIRLKSTDEVSCPAICGFWRPTIFFPRRLLSLLSDEQFELIFVHELSHWKRGDLHINLLQTLLQVLYFYNPLLWFANSRLRRLREEAVDDAVLVVGNSGSEIYSTTLLDIAAQALRPAEMSLRLIGILESRSSLTQRIRRMALGTAPKSARLGFWGLAAVVVAGVALLPMASKRNTVAADLPNPAAGAQGQGAPAAKTPPSKNKNQSTQKVPQVILRGRVVDDRGDPVTDAELHAYPPRNAGHWATGKTQKDGRFELVAHNDGRIDQAGDFRIDITSNRCLSKVNREALSVKFDPLASEIREFTLKRACRIQVHVVDEMGQPVKGVRFYLPPPHTNSIVSTDRDGMALVGGLVPTKVVQHVALVHSDYAVQRIQYKLSDPDKIEEQNVVLKKGFSVKGKAICSDGQPPAGWGIRALPIWWDLWVYPGDHIIEQDGSFELKHVGTDRHSVTISVPHGQFFTPKVVLSDADLTKEKQPLQLTLNEPSPASTTTITGKVAYTGEFKEQTIRVQTVSDDGQFDYHHSIYTHHRTIQRRGKQEIAIAENSFDLGPLPKGRYTLTFESPEIETKVITGVVAPQKSELIVELKRKEKSAGGENYLLKGRVERTASAFKNLQFRVAMMDPPRHNNKWFKMDWREVTNADGKFSVEVPSHAVYSVQARADGFTISSVDRVNTDKLPPGKEVLIKLTEGITQRGVVVDEQGQPIDGAIVSCLMHGGHPLPCSMIGVNDKGIRTVRGQFTLPNLAPGYEMISVVHPDYACSKVHGLNYVAGKTPDLLRIVLKRGGSLRGRVYDEAGQPVAGANILVHPEHARIYDDPFGPPKEVFANVNTDEDGRFSANHLPSERIHIHRVQRQQVQGVVMQSIYPIDGQQLFVTLGGQSQVTGRLLVDGKAIANSRIQFSDSSPHFGGMQAFSRTDGEGNFVFRGITAGEFNLYFAIQGRRFEEWVLVKPFHIAKAGTELGTIDHRTGSLIVKLPASFGKNADRVWVQIGPSDPVWLQRVSNTNHEPRVGADVPYVFKNLPVGKYIVTGRRENLLGVSQEVEITLNQLQKEITLDAARGTAKVEGTLNRDGVAKAAYSLQLRSTDNRLVGHLRVDDQGRFAMGEIPAGEYYLTTQGIRDADAYARFTLKAGETKTVSLTGDQIQKSARHRGVLHIAPRQPNGVSLPGCTVILTGKFGPVPTRTVSDSQSTFYTDPGPYQLSVTYPGFKTVTQAVEVKSPSERSSGFEKYTVAILMVPEEVK